MQEWLCPTQAGEFTAPETDDQTIVVFLEGTGILEAWKDGRWNSAYRPCGSVGLTAPGERDRLRWRNPSSPFVRAAYIYLPKQYLADASDAFQHGAKPHRATRLSALNLLEPTVRGIALGLVEGLRAKAAALYADTAAVYLATHLVTMSQRPQQGTHGRPLAGLSDRRLARVIEYMRSNLSEQISLHALSDEACLSRFHFVRAFKERVGSTPIQYLAALRMERAYSLLLKGTSPIAEIARQCGYTTLSAFSNAVRRHYGMSPAALRNGR